MAEAALECPGQGEFPEDDGSGGNELSCQCTSTRGTGRKLEDSMLCRAACLQLHVCLGEPPPFPAAAAAAVFLQSPPKAAWAAETECVLRPLPQQNPAPGWEQNLVGGQWAGPWPGQRQHNLVLRL